MSHLLTACTTYLGPPLALFPLMSIKITQCNFITIGWNLPCQPYIIKTFISHSIIFQLKYSLPPYTLNKTHHQFLGLLYTIDGHVPWEFVGFYRCLSAFSSLPIMPKYSVGACTIYSGPPSAFFYIRIVMLSIKITGKQFYRDWLEFYGSGPYQD